MSFQSAAAQLRSAALIMTKSRSFRTTLLVDRGSYLPLKEAGAERGDNGPNAHE